MFLQAAEDHFTDSPCSNPFLENDQTPPMLLNLDSPQSIKPIQTVLSYFQKDIADEDIPACKDDNNCKWLYNIPHMLKKLSAVF